MSKKTSIGGQALMEGIMMVGPNSVVAAFCDTEGKIETEEIKPEYIRDKYPILKKPFLRGIFNFVDTLKLGTKAMELATNRITSSEEMEAESKFEKWLDNKLGEKFTKVLLAISTVLGVVMSVFLFLYLPALVFSGATMLFGESIEPFRAMTEGILKFVIFVLYIVLIGMIPDIKRVFQFHGAEHKTIFCYEQGLELNVENIKKQTRFHPRCGTSFLIILIILGIIVGLFIPFTNPVLRTVCKILTLPIVVSIGYELIKICGKYDNVFTKMVSAPGLWVQRFTTKEPDDKMIETAIAAMEAVIPENNEDIIG